MKYLLCLLLAGCATFQHKTELPKADDAVFTSCVEKAPVSPKFYTDEQLVKLSPADFVTVLHIDRQRMLIYIGELETTVAGCR